MQLLEFLFLSMIYLCSLTNENVAFKPLCQHHPSSKNKQANKKKQAKLSLFGGKLQKTSDVLGVCPHRDHPSCVQLQYIIGTSRSSFVLVQLGFIMLTSATLKSECVYVNYGLSTAQSQVLSGTVMGGRCIKSNAMQSAHNSLKIL